MFGWFKSKKKNKKNVRAYYDGSSYKTRQELGFFPFLNSGGLNSADYQALAKTGRFLYDNTPECRAVVDAMVQFCNTLKPLPASSDDAWNEEAAKAFNQYVASDDFEVSGRFNFRQLQSWVEKQAIIDGDCLVVLLAEGEGEDLKHSVQLVPGVNVSGGTDGNGVLTDDLGRITEYMITTANGGSITIPGDAAILYTHGLEPDRARGLSELVAAIKNAVSLRTLNGYLLECAKLTASFALVETKSMGDKSPDQSAFIRRRRQEQSDEPEVEPTLFVGDSKVISLAEGRKLETIADNRPSQNLQAFSRTLVSSLAYSVGLDPVLIFESNLAKSSNSRMILEKLRFWIETRLVEREKLLNKIYQHVINGLILAGRLSYPTTEDYVNVRWVKASSDMSIDISRVGTMTANLIKQGLADADAFTQATTGLTYKQLLARKAENLSYAKQLAEKHHLSLDQLISDISEEIPVVDAPEVESENTDLEPESLEELETVDKKELSEEFAAA